MTILAQFLQFRKGLVTALAGKPYTGVTGPTALQHASGQVIISPSSFEPAIPDVESKTVAIDTARSLMAPTRSRLWSVAMTVEIVSSGIDQSYAWADDIYATWAGLADVNGQKYAIVSLSIEEESLVDTASEPAHLLRLVFDFTMRNS